MTWMKRYLRSTIGLKQVMGATGLGLVLFVIIHMLGNLQIFLGADAFNAYPVKLRSLGALLWVARAGLLAIFLIHVFAAIRLVMINRAARDVSYKVYRPRRATFYGRYMGMLGVVILAYLVYHLAHFTFGYILPEHATNLDELGRPDLFHYVVASFQNTPIAASYLVANALLCLHLLHGLPSLFQSVGLRHPKYNPLIDRISLGVVTLIFVGNTAIPLAVMTGTIKLPEAF